MKDTENTWDVNPTWQEPPLRKNPSQWVKGTRYCEVRSYHTATECSTGVFKRHVDEYFEGLKEKFYENLREEYGESLPDGCGLRVELDAGFKLFDEKPYIKVVV